MKVSALLRNVVRNSQLLITIGMLTLLIVLAGLQYLWLGQLSEGEREQMRSHLNGVASRFREDFDGELMRTMGAFDFGFERRSPTEALTSQVEPSIPETYVEKYERWRKTAAHPGLVSGLHLAIADRNGNLTLYELNREELTFNPVDWPSDLSAHKVELEAQIMRSRNPGPPQERRPAEGPNGAITEKPLALIARIPLAEFRNGPQNPGRPGAGPPPPLSGYAIIRLNSDVITREIFPELARRNLGPSDSSNYDLRIVRRSSPSQIIFQYPPDRRESGSSQGQQNAPDVSMGLFSLGPGPGPGGGPRREPPMRRPPEDFPRPPGARGFRPGGFPGLWEIQLRHHSGSLEAAVASIRRRNLIVSFSILGLLAASIAMLIGSARRSRRLAHQQMDFVAGVSHELRTPLSVIETAAYNLDKGIIRTEQQTKAYGAMIGKEAARLKRMVEQMLEYAGVEAGRVDYAIESANINQIINNAIIAAQPLIAESGFTVDQRVEQELPPVLADPAALARALENLISNAVKYGGEDKWIGIRAVADPSFVTVEVSDHGEGIPSDEVSHIFEPFYRGSEAKSRQIRGNGLGLSIVKHIVGAHGGTIRVESARKSGTKFILTVPLARQEMTIERPLVSLSDYEQTNSAG